MLEKTAQRVTLRLVDKLAMKVMKETSGFKTITEKGCATAMLIGKAYWSKIHIDYNFHLTIMTVLAPECNNKDKTPECKNKDKEIIYYFIFPTYKIAVPMISGDVVLFIPRIIHSCLNPRYSGSCIMLAYVSCETVLCADSNKLDTNN